MTRLKLPFVRWSVVLAWAGLIFFLSSRPVLPAPAIPYIDKVFHACEFGVLAFLLAWAALPVLHRHPLPVRWGVVIVASFIYAVADEMHQAYVPGRSCDPADALADLTGIVVAALITQRANRTRGRTL